MSVWFLTTALFWLGASLASALLCFSWRNARAQKARKFSQHSGCDVCGKTLPWYALVPVLGYFFVRGKCQSCKHFAPYYSFLGEFLTGIIWALIFSYNPSLNILSLIGIFLLSAILICLIISDFFWQEIPSPLIWVSYVLIGFLVFYQLPWLPSLGSSVSGALITAGFFLWQYVLSRGRWVSPSDLWVGILSGALIGWNQVVLVTAIAYVGAAVYAILSASVKKQKRLERVPLSAFLAWSTLIFLLAKLV